MKNLIWVEAESHLHFELRAEGGEGDVAADIFPTITKDSETLAWFLDVQGNPEKNTTFNTLTEAKAFALALLS